MRRGKPCRQAALAVCLLTIFVPAALAQGEAGPPPDPAPPPAAEPSAVPPSPPPAGNTPQETLPPPAEFDTGRGGGAGVSPLMGLVGQAPLRADLRSTWFSSERVAGQSTDLGLVREEFSLGFPIWQCGCDEWSGFLGGRGEFFSTHAVLPTTGQPFPDELWNLRLGTTYRHQFDNGWITGGTVSVGSASDRPFHSIDEMTAGVNAFLRVPQGEHNAWLFTLAYSPTSELPIPIPGVAYLYQPSDRFRANLGLPFRLTYRPLDDLTLDLSYMLLTTVHARATYCVCKPVRVYAGFDWEDESYFLADRPDTRDRFFSYDKRLTAGVQAPVGRHVFLDLSSGYVFDRFYFEGHSFSDRHDNRVDVAPGAFISFDAQVRW